MSNGFKAHSPPPIMYIIAQVFQIVNIMVMLIVKGLSNRIIAKHI